MAMALPQKPPAPTTIAEAQWCVGRMVRRIAASASALKASLEYEIGIVDEVDADLQDDDGNTMPGIFLVIRQGFTLVDEDDVPRPWREFRCLR